MLAMRRVSKEVNRTAASSFLACDSAQTEGCEHPTEKIAPDSGRTVDEDSLRDSDRRTQTSWSLFWPLTPQMRGQESWKWDGIRGGGQVKVRLAVSAPRVGAKQKRWGRTPRE
ncbi:hypothetical protein BV25DRAFT_133070 [Artomyces pyxidatus]|uniref:Uncharacterized protein n=1 Tax=Artomyces pyxidatus TaxID=48021 RepID=A0ACB8T9F7_9AGAM|nr:hypothetical protein BV25DRAFT_133070 [Artomyces pyxidatus]